MTTDIEKLTTDIAVRAQGLVVADTESFNRANEIVVAGKLLIITIKEYFKDVIAAAKASYEKNKSLQQVELDKVEPIVKRLGDEGAAYLYQEREKRRKAEAEAARVEAERKRNEEEALARAREAEMRALNAKTAGDRKKAEAEADAIMAKAAAQEEKIVAAAPIVPEKIRVQDQTLRDNWSAVVDNFQGLILAVVEGQISPEALLPNEPWLNKQARDKKKGLDIPGVLRAVNKPSMVRTS